MLQAGTRLSKSRFSARELASRIVNGQTKDAQNRLVSLAGCCLPAGAPPATSMTSLVVWANTETHTRGGASRFEILLIMFLAVLACIVWMRFGFALGNGLFEKPQAAADPARAASVAKLGARPPIKTQISKATTSPMGTSDSVHETARSFYEGSMASSVGSCDSGHETVRRMHEGSGWVGTTEPMASLPVARVCRSAGGHCQPSSSSKLCALVPGPYSD